MAHWKGVFREKGEELRGAVEEWQQKRAASGPRLTTGFLDGASPIVDVYELKVRLRWVGGLAGSWELGGLRNVDEKRWPDLVVKAGRSQPLQRQGRGPGAALAALSCRENVS